jgi:hypothetical protein
VKRFLRDALLFVLVLLVAGSILDYVVTTGLKRSRLPDHSVWNDIVSGAASSDVLIMGSSRAEVQFSPKIIGDRLGMTCYNLGTDGYPLEMQLARYALYRKYDDRPKVVVLVVDTYGLVKRDDLFRPQQFLPYLNEPTIRDAVAASHYFQWSDYYLPAVRYHGDWRTVYRGSMLFLGRRAYTDVKQRGFLAVDQNWSDDLAKFVATHPNGVALQHSAVVEQELDDFLTQTGQQGIQVVLVFPPEYIKAQPLFAGREDILGIYRRLAQEHGLRFLDYSNDPISYDTKYFYNSQHMNKLGAELFSTEFAGTLADLVR